MPTIRRSGKNGRWHPAGNGAELEAHRGKVQSLLRQVLRFDPERTAPLFETRAAVPRQSGMLTPLILRPEQGILLPSIFLEPHWSEANRDVKRIVWQRKSQRDNPWIESEVVYPTGPVVLYMNDSGKGEILRDSAIAEKLLAAGFRILAVDLRGTGETAPGLESLHWDFLAGKPIFGQRAEDVLACLQWMARPELRGSDMYIWARGVSGLIAACAAIYGGRITGLILEEPLISFESVVAERLVGCGDEVLVPGILRLLDLPQIYEALAPRRMTIINPLLADREPAGKTDVENSYGSVADCYRMAGRPDNWVVSTGAGELERSELILAAFGIAGDPGP